MAKKSRFPAVKALLLALFASSQTSHGQEVRLALTPEMVINESDRGNPQAMVDEQELIVEPHGTCYTGRNQRGTVVYGLKK